MNKNITLKQRIVLTFLIILDIFCFVLGSYILIGSNFVRNNKEESKIGSSKEYYDKVHRELISGMNKADKDAWKDVEPTQEYIDISHKVLNEEECLKVTSESGDYDFKFMESDLSVGDTTVINGESKIVSSISKATVEEKEDAILVLTKRGYYEEVMYEKAKNKVNSESNNK